MNAIDSLELIKKYANCPNCGNVKIGNGEGTLEINDEVFTRTCKCGYSVTEDKRIKVIATATKRAGRKTEAIVEVKIDNHIRHKFLPGSKLKELSGAKRMNQYKKMEGWLNTKEGRKWANETPHVTDF